MLISQPCARRAHRNSPTHIHPPSVGKIYSIPTHIFNCHIFSQKNCSIYTKHIYIVFKFLIPSAFQKYNICWVYGDRSCICVFVYLCICVFATTYLHFRQSINQWFILLNNPLGFSKSGRQFAEPPARQGTQKYFTMGEQVDHNGATHFAVWWNMLNACVVVL